MRKAAAMLGLGTASALAAGCGASVDTLAAGDQLLAPDATGWVDRSATGTTGIQGQWHAFADDRFGAPPSGCQTAALGECSIVHEPTPGSPYAPTSGLGMCTFGIIARWIYGSPGLTPDYSPGWAGIVLGLGMPDWPEPRASVGPPAGRPYDAVAHEVTGFAFDIDSEPPPNAKIAVELTKNKTNMGAPPTWGGQIGAQWSPVHAGHNEFKWEDVGGPWWVTPQPKFDASLLKQIAFHVLASPTEAVNYSFCINNLTALRH